MRNHHSLSCTNRKYKDFFFYLSVHSQHTGVVVDDICFCLLKSSFNNINVRNFTKIWHFLLWTTGNENVMNTSMNEYLLSYE